MVRQSPRAKRSDRLSQLFGYRFRHVMFGLHWPSLHVVGPTTPDLERISEQVSEVISCSPEHERWRGDRPPRRHVGLVVRAVDAQPGPVVLEHAVDRLRVVDRVSIVLIVLLPHRLRVICCTKRRGREGSPAPASRTRRRRTNPTTLVRMQRPRGRALPRIGTASRTPRCVTDAG
jgi:hypothetical protein